MLTKEQIIDEIRRTAKENSGQPLGESRFTKETGIKPYDWKKYWARFGDAQKDAGFSPNTLQVGYTDDFITRKMIELIRKLGKFPSHGELRVAKNHDPEFPSSGSLFDTKEEKRQLANKIVEWCKDKTGYDDVIKLSKPILEIEFNNDPGVKTNITSGEVYLFKSGKYFKIGKTNNTVRRGNELRIQLPEKTDLIHSIKTDDPTGVELYWHKRFEEKRMNGEWFNLNSSDIKAFKAWRRII